MSGNGRNGVLIPHRCGKSLVIDERFVNLSSLNPKDFIKNPLRVHEPLAIERKLFVLEGLKATRNTLMRPREESDRKMFLMIPGR